MAYVLCRKSDGVVLGASRWDAYTVDPATVQITVADVPSGTASLRWDGKEGLRDETAQEAAARIDAVSSKFMDDATLCLATIRWVAQKLGVAPATARSEILAIYRSLQN